MNEAEYQQVRRGETDRVEWKESDRNAPPILRAVCAMANDLGASGAPGYVLLGMRDDGVWIGLDSAMENQDAALRAVTGPLSSVKLLPTPSCDAEVVTFDGRRGILIRVHPAAVPPVVQLDGTTWVRVGTETRRARDADVARLAERRPEASQAFDLRPMPAAGVEDLDLAALRHEHEAARALDLEQETFPALEPWLVSRELARRVGPVWRPTAAGILQFGLDPQVFLPGAFVIFARYAGADFDSPVISRKEIRGTIFDQLDGLWAVLDAQLTETPDPVQGIRETYRPDYPPEALRELSRNLLQHRRYDGTNAPARVSWFADSIVFNNPGGPFGQAGEGEFGEHSDYRNPTLTRGLHLHGYVQQLGRGVRKVRRLLAENGNPPLEVETDGFTTLTIRRRRP